MTEPREDQAEIRRQIELERSWVDEGIKEYEELRERRGEANLPPGIKLTMKLMEPVVEGIKELCLGTNIRQKPVRTRPDGRWERHLPAWPAGAGPGSRS